MLICNVFHFYFLMGCFKKFELQWLVHLSSSKAELLKYLSHKTVLDSKLSNSKSNKALIILILQAYSLRLRKIYAINENKSGTT